MFVSTILEKFRKSRSRFSQGSVTVLSNMASYKEGKIKLTLYN